MKDDNFKKSQACKYFFSNTEIYTVGPSEALCLSVKMYLLLSGTKLLCNYILYSSVSY